MTAPRREYLHRIEWRAATKRKRFTKYDTPELDALAEEARLKRIARNKLDKRNNEARA